MTSQSLSKILKRAIKKPMIMQHITITNLDNGYVSLVPDKGYRLFSKATNAFYSEAVVKPEKVNDFSAIAED